MDKEGNKINYIIDSVIFVITLFFCCMFCSQLSKSRIIQKLDISHAAAALALALCVHTLKGLRLYILMFGKTYTFRTYLKLYVKTAFVNIMIPLKAGELYRGYCIGRLAGSAADGYIIVLFDRFVDTLALISAAAVSAVCGKLRVTVIYSIFAAVLLLLIFSYILFRPLYQYWNHFLIFKKSSTHTLAALEILEVCNASFENISAFVKGRFAVLYVISLFAWAAEIWGYFLRPDNFSPAGLGVYLENILKGAWEEYNLFYALACFSVFAICLALEFMTRRKSGGSACSIR